MSVTVFFEGGTKRDFPNGATVQPRGQGVIVASADGKEIAALDGPVVSVRIDGQEINWPPA